MKVSTSKKKEFKPRELTITFESQVEMDKFYCLFNYTPITEWLNPHVDHDAITDALDDLGGDHTLRWSSFVSALND